MSRHRQSNALRKPVVQWEGQEAPPPFIRVVSLPRPSLRSQQIRTRHAVRRNPFRPLLAIVLTVVLLAVSYRFHQNRSFQRRLSVPLEVASLALMRPDTPVLSGRGVVGRVPTVQEHVAVGTVTSSFSQAATKAGVPPALIDDLVDLFSDRVSFDRHFRVGDRFSLIFRETREGGSARIEILAAALEIGGEHLVAARYVGTDGKARYFNERSEVIGNAFLRYPVQFSKITSYFSESRFHPVLRIRRPHNGVDFAAPVGTPVRAVANGRIVAAGRRGPNGIMVQIEHGDRYQTAYLHLSRLGPGIKGGVSVAKGQIIGAVGATGLATGPHLHYALFDRGKYTDPLRAKLPIEEDLGRGKMIDRRYLDKVLFTLNHYQSLDLAKLATG